MKATYKLFQDRTIVQLMGQIVTNKGQGQFGIFLESLCQHVQCSGYLQVGRTLQACSLQA